MERGVLVYTSNRVSTENGERRPHFPFHLLSRPLRDGRAVGHRTLRYQCNDIIPEMQGEVRFAVMREFRDVWSGNGDTPEVNFLPQSGRTRITFVDVVFRHSAQFQQAVNMRDGLPVISVCCGRSFSQARSSEAMPIQLHPVVHGMDFGPDIFVMQVTRMPDSVRALGHFRALIQTVAELLDLWKVVEDELSLGARASRAGTFRAVGRLHGGVADGAEYGAEYSLQQAFTRTAIANLPGWLVIDSYGSTPKEGYMLSYVGRQPWCHFCNWRETRHARHLSKECPHDEEQKQAFKRDRRRRWKQKRASGDDPKARSSVQRSAVASMRNGTVGEAPM